MKNKKVAAKQRIRRTKKPLAKPLRAKLLRRNPQKVLAKRKLRNARPVHKKLLLHPFTVLMLLIVGVFIVGMTYQTIADDYAVTAVVQAEPLTEGATITYPVDGASLTSTPINVSGTCPYGSYVKLYDNGLFSGVAWCVPAGTFQIETDLFDGKNVLLAEAFNITDQQGPATPSISIDYQAPAQANSGSSGSSSSSSNQSTGSNSSVGAASSSANSENSGSVASTPTPLLLTTDFQYQTFTTSTTFSWSMDLEGGTPPYTVGINWGDGQTSTAVYKTDPVFKITHDYKKQGYYPIKVDAVDAHGNHRLIQLAALIKLPGAPGIFTTNSGKPATPPSVKQNQLVTFFTDTKGWLWIAWPSFIIVLLMMISFWLGERQEYHDIFRNRRRGPRHQPLSR